MGIAVVLMPAGREFATPCAGAENVYVLGLKQVTNC